MSAITAPARSSLRWRPYPSLVVIAAREVYGHATTPLVWAMVAFAMLMAGLSTRVGLQELQARRSAYSEFMAERGRDRDRVRGQAIGWQLDPGLRVVRAPVPTSAIVAGVDTSIPQFWDFGPAGVRAGGPYAGAGEAAGVMDLEVIIRVVLGLLAIILAVESVAGERASGALLALLGQPVRPGVVLLGKLLGGTVTAAVAVAAVVLTVLAVAALSETLLVARGFLVSTAAVGAAGWLYLFTFFTFGVLVSALVQSYRAAFTTAIMVWLVAGATGSEVARVIARSLAPTVPVAIVEAQRDGIVETERRQVQLEMGVRYREGLSSGADVLKPNLDPPEHARALVNVQPVWDRYVASTRTALERVAAAHDGALARQRRIGRVFGLLSPGAQFAIAATNLAGTGDVHAQRWALATKEYQRQLDTQLFDDPARLTLMVPKEPQEASGSEGRWLVALTRRKAPTFDALPAVTPPPEGFPVRLGDAAPSLLMLASVALALVMAGAAAFGRIRF